MSTCNACGTSLSLTKYQVSTCAVVTGVQVPFLAELLKLLVSVYLLREQQRSAPEAARMTRTWQSVALFPFPSIIYWVHNNVQARIPVPPLPPPLSCYTFPAAFCQAQSISTALDTLNNLAGCDWI